MKKNRRRMLRNPLMKVLGVVLMISLVLANSVTLIFANTPEVSKGDLIQGSVTVSSPRALSEIALPSNSYGTLSWKSPSTVVSGSSGSYGVVFKAYADAKADFSKVSGWDGESRSVTGSVTVYVKNASQEKAESEPQEEKTEGESASQEEPDQGSSEEEDSTHTEDDGQRDTEDQDDGEEDSQSEVVDEDEEIGSLEKDPKKQTQGEEAEDAKDGDSAKEDSQNGASENAGSAVKDPDEEGSRIEEIKEDTGKDKDKEEKPEEPKAVEELPEGEESQAGGLIEETLPETPMDLVQETERPTEVREDFNPEEQAAVAAQNHTCQGITVSGYFLPWYVQFRVYDGSGFGFTNAAEADSFQAYEFQLWDLLNDEEYQIPEGETVQVTMPVSSGYDYSIQHILPDGSVETITPSVFGNTLVFSASSFSPFGIAGSKPLVGGDIADSGYSQGNVGGSQNGSSSNSSSTGSSSGSSGSSGSSTGSSQTGSSSSKASAGSSSSSSTSSSAGSNSGGQQTVSSGSGSAQTVGIQPIRTTPNPVKTGDETNVVPFVIIALGALLVIGALILAIKNKRK